MRRRAFLASSAAGAAAWLAGRPAGAAADAHGAERAAADGPLVFVGTYTSKTASRGVYRFRADARTGAWAPLGVTDAGPDPSFLAVHPNGRVLYAVNETERFAGEASGAVRAFRIDRRTGDLAPLGDPVPTGGGAPCYVSVDATGGVLLVANYAGGSVAAFPLAADGRPGARTFLDQHAGRGPRADRQEAPHAHCVVPDPSNRWAVAADLGLDQLSVYALDARARTLSRAGRAATRPGAGPRHLAFHPSGRALYAVGELDLTLVTFPFDPDAGTLGTPASAPLLAAAAPAGSTAADLHLHPSGRALYVSVRGDDSLACFAVDPATGRATFVERVATGGRRPRNFGLDPAGRFLYAANQGSDAVELFRVGGAGGRVTPAGRRVAVPSPVCVRFA
jgi:6-phosphogluconolactonase